MNNQKTPKQTLTRLFSPLVSLSSLIAVMAVLLNFDLQTNYFQTGAILPAIATITSLLTTAVGVILSLSQHNKNLQNNPFEASASPALAFYGFIAAALLLFVKEISATTILMAVTLALSAVYISFTSNCHLKKDAATTVYYGFATILTPIFFCALFYFDASIEINAPMKTASILSLLCCMIYFTGELRFLLNRPMKKLFLVFAHITASISIPASLAIFASFIKGLAYTLTEMPRAPILAVIKAQNVEYISAAVMMLLIALQALDRANHLLSLKNNEEAPEGDAQSTNEADLKDPSAPSPEKEHKKQPLPWEIDIDTLTNRKE